MKRKDRLLARVNTKSKSISEFISHLTSVCHSNRYPSLFCMTFPAIFPVPIHASVLCVFGCPLLWSSCTSSRPSLKSLCHSKPLDFFIASSPQATVNRVNVSLAQLQIFTQNLMFIRCSRLLSLIFPPTVYHGHVLLPLLLGNERLIWSFPNKNASWNMSKRAGVHEFVWLNTPTTRCDYSGN